MDNQNLKHHIEFDLELRKNPYSGTYIALEGIDGSGKTLQVELLRIALEKQGKQVVTTREPRKKSGLIGELNKQILQGNIQIHSSAFQYLFTADRVMQHEELVIPALKEGKIVITDRCFWSAVPYGTVDRVGDFDVNQAEQIMIAQGILSMYHQFIKPDITFYLQLPLDTSVARLPHKQETNEIYEKKEVIEKTLKGYEWLLKEFPGEFTIVDGAKSIEELNKELLNKIIEYTNNPVNKSTQ